MIKWEESRKQFIDVENYLIGIHNADMQSGVRDFKYLKKEIRWLI